LELLGSRKDHEKSEEPAPYKHTAPAADMDDGMPF